jgi:ribosome-associated protein
MARKTVSARSASRTTNPASPRLDEARRFAIEAAQLCADRRCRDVRVLEVAGLSPICDFFVLASAAGARQMGTIVREIEDLAARNDLPELGGRRSQPNDRWMAVDLVDVIVHLFSEEARLFYDLDNLWGDAREVVWARKK